MTDQPSESQQTPVAAPHEPFEPSEEPDGWYEEPETLPPRPRRRLLTPLPVGLLCVLLTACGFIGGVLVEKGQEGSSGSSAAGGSGLASRFAALRGAGGAASSSTSGASGAASAFGAGGAADGATIGQVAFIEGSTLYVTDTTGNTIKVRTSAASAVTRTVSGTVRSIHPGEQVIISGTAAADGTVTAATIRVGATSSGGLGGLFGGGTGSGSRSGTGTSTSGGSGAPSLFGSG